MNQIKWEVAPGAGIIQHCHFARKTQTDQKKSKQSIVKDTKPNETLLAKCAKFSKNVFITFF